MGVYGGDDLAYLWFTDLCLGSYGCCKGRGMGKAKNGVGMKSETKKNEKRRK